ncbi:MAG: hypothetical protein Q8L39_16590 [Burkholderiales bacterium]|nr:hypothetical protein [Burkholderiales bacterium]
MQLFISLNAWGTPAFEVILKNEIEQMDAALLPLQQGLAQSSYTDGANRSVMIISVTEGAGFIRVKTGIFYTGMIAGCSCADDPTPMSELAEYCEVQFDIDQITAETTVTLLEE